MVNERRGKTGKLRQAPRFFSICAFFLADIELQTGIVIRGKEIRCVG